MSTLLDLWCAFRAEDVARFRRRRQWGRWSGERRHSIRRRRWNRPSDSR